MPSVYCLLSIILHCRSLALGLRQEVWSILPASHECWTPFDCWRQQQAAAVAATTVATAATAAVQLLPGLMRTAVGCEAGAKDC